MQPSACSLRLAGGNFLLLFSSCCFFGCWQLKFIITTKHNGCWQPKIIINKTKNTPQKQKPRANQGGLLLHRPLGDPPSENVIDAVRKRLGDWADPNPSRHEIHEQFWYRNLKPTQGGYYAQVSLPRVNVAADRAVGFKTESVHVGFRAVARDAALLVDAAVRLGFELCVVFTLVVVSFSSITNTNKNKQKPNPNKKGGCLQAAPTPRPSTSTTCSRPTMPTSPWPRT
jgi:hypothetical protein